MPAPARGAIRLRGVSRSFRITHERNATLKEALLRRRRTTYTEHWALLDVDLDIEPGESVGIIGQNGSGKSTLLKLVAGILYPQAGTVESGGAVASMLELGAGFHPDFTGRENVYMNGSIHGLTEREIDARFGQIVEFAEMEEFVDMPVKTYSSGMMMRLAFAVASHVNPDILLIDEVLAVGDEAFQHKCLGRISDFKRRGGTLVFVSHDPSIVEQVCDRAILIQEGRVVADGRPAETLNVYHRALAAAPQAPTPHRDEAEAEGDDDDESTLEGSWGSQRITIDEVSLIGPNGPSDRFLAGGQMTIRLVVSAADPVEQPTFGFGIFAVEGPYLLGLNTRLAEFDIGVFSGRQVVEFHVRELPLNTGRFTVTVAAESSDSSEVYHWLDRTIDFSVFQDGPGVGMVRVAGEWSIKPDVRQCQTAATDGVPDPGLVN